MASFEHQRSAAPRRNSAGALDAHTSLGMLRALLNLESGADSCSVVLQVLRDTFGCDQALMLEEHDNGLHCTAALPTEPVGRQWAAAQFFENILQGGVMATGPDRTDDWQDAPADLISPSQIALCFPVGVCGTRAVLIMLRAEHHFSDEHLALAR